MSRITTLFLALAALVAVSAPSAVAAGKDKKKATTVKVSRGATTLALSEGAAKALTDLQIVAGPIGSARAGDAGIAFPVTNGRLNAKTYAGIVRHTGGLRLQRGDTVVDLYNFAIEIDGTPELTAVVGGSRIAIADLDLSGAKIAATKRTLSVGNVVVALNETAAGALNGAFGTTAFTTGLVLGTASLETRIVGTKKK